MLPQKIGRYKIKGILGQGRFGMVYHAYDPNFERDVALKVLPPEPLVPLPGQEADALRFFLREARIVGSFHHPAIVPVFDFDKEGGYPFIVMLLMKGGSLKPRLAKGPLPLHEIVRILESLAPALDKVHRRKIIHRDLKPSNILFDEDDRPYIADFGLAKLTEATNRYAGNSAGLGTAHYMSPEQARGDDKLDGRCDLYSLGATLFQMLTGKPPYHKVHPAALVHFHMNEPIPRLDELRTDLPAGSQAVIDRAMAKKADDRYASAGELVAALKALLEDADEYVRRANRSYSLRELDQAILQYSEALRIKPDHALAYFGRANAYHDKGLLEAAIADYTQVLKLTPHYMAAYFRRAQAYEQKGEHQLVIADYSQLLRIKSDHTSGAFGPLIPHSSGLCSL
jgi:serine/threonine-protein kinase